MKNICVFCGGSSLCNPLYLDIAREFGQAMVKEGYGLVYGGGNVGLMGVLADSVMQAGGQVIGIMPKFLVERERAHQKISQLHIVDTLFERKQLMIDLSQAFLTLPGGTGTLDELFEALTWKQLGQIDKPVALLNINHFYDKLLEFFKHLQQEKFLYKPIEENLIIAEDIPQLFQSLS